MIRPTALLALGFLGLSAPRPLATQEPIATDRPDFVESSNTVGRGAFQFETSASTDWTTASGITARTVATPTLFRYGISTSLELRVESDGFTHAMLTGAASVDGVSDAAIGLKWHALDAKGAIPSTAFLLHADLPSGSEAFRGDGVRPSLRAVGEWELPADFALGLMPGIAYDVAANGERVWTPILGATTGHPITENTRWFIEYAAVSFAAGQGTRTVAYFDVGTAWIIRGDAQLDLSYRRGLTDVASDHTVAIGFSRRFR